MSRAYASGVLWGARHAGMGLLRPSGVSNARSLLEMADVVPWARASKPTRTASMSSAETKAAWRRARSCHGSHQRTGAKRRVRLPLAAAVEGRYGRQTPREGYVGRAYVFRVPPVVEQLTLALSGLGHLPVTAVKRP